MFTKNSHFTIKLEIDVKINLYSRGIDCGFKNYCKLFIF